MGRPQARAASNGGRAWMILLATAILSFGGTALAALSLHGTEQRLIDRGLNRRSVVITDAITDRIGEYTTAAGYLAAAVGAQRTLEAGEFQAITAVAATGRLPAADQVGLVAATPTEGVAELQEHWHELGATTLALQPEPDVPAHYFVVLNRELTETVTGFGVGEDLAGSAPMTTALSTATLRTEVALATVGEPDGIRFVVVAPIFSQVAGHSLTGWVVMPVRGADLLRPAIAGTAQDAVSATLTAPGDSTPAVAPGDSTPAVAPGDGTPTVAWHTDRPTISDAVRTTAVTIGEQEWALTVRPTRGLLSRNEATLDTAAWVIGTVITVLLVALVASLLTSRSRALQRVAHATAALHSDITRRKQVEQRLRRREAELVGFAGMIAHDLRSPLAILAGNADLLFEESRGLLPPDAMLSLDRIRGTATRMSTLIDELLAYATADNVALKTAPVDLNALVNDLVAEYRGNPAYEKAIFELDLLPTIDADPHLIRQLFDNLLGNALKYAHDGRTPHITVDARLEGDVWALTVADNGIGIPQGQHAEVFTAFTRARGSENRPGTGLGLAICQRIAERHDGTITASPNTGVGTRFTILLPTGAATPEPPSEPPAEPSADETIN
ncbi:HAMP domain-containing sensor histidine kinase [Actinoplanes sp. NPDC051851]|uniref:sensor histidine kinase n=1 Tax=Actinoplanes sp. NPDC051851 TaxID=3154753 RepID=UPI003415D305